MLTSEMTPDRDNRREGSAGISFSHPESARSRVRVWLCPVAASVGQTPVRTLRQLRSAHLRRFSLQAYNGPHIGRGKDWDLAALVASGQV